MSMQKAKLTFLICEIENVISKNRDLLSVEDVQILEQCAKDLIKMRDSDSLNTTFGYVPNLVQVILSLLKFFTDDI